jgi:hypothetical protein
MRRAREMLIGVGALVVLGGVLAASALALQSEWSIEAETFAERKLKEEKVTLSGGPVTLSVPGKGLTIKCESTEGSGKYFEGGSDELKVTLGKCKVVEPVSCKVSETISLEAKTVQIMAGNAFYDKLVPLTEGKAFGSITLTGEKCVFAEKNELAGAVAATISSEEAVKLPLGFSESTTKLVNEGLKAAGEAELALTFAKTTALVSGEVLTQLAGGNAGRQMREEPFTKLCESATIGLNNSCPGKIVASGGAINMTKIGSMKFEYGTTTITCAESKLEGNTLSAGAAPLPVDLSVIAFNNCNSGACTVKALGTPSRVFFRTIFGGNGTLTVRTTTLETVCGGITCKFSKDRLRFAVAGGATAKLESAPQSLGTVAGPMGCGGSVTWKGSGTGGDIEYEFLAPKPLLVTAS